jgi:IMP dehydrogenase
MAGGLFAGCEESPGETIILDGRKFKVYRGMGSLSAMAMGSKDRYFQDVEDDIRKLVPEGIEGRMPYTGSIHEVMLQYIGGLRAGMGYCGAKDINALHDANFVRSHRPVSRKVTHTMSRSRRSLRIIPVVNFHGRQAETSC